MHQLKVTQTPFKKFADWLADQNATQLVGRPAEYQAEFAALILEQLHRRHRLSFTTVDDAVFLGLDDDGNDIPVILSTATTSYVRLADLVKAADVDAYDAYLWVHNEQVADTGVLPGGTRSVDISPDVIDLGFTVQSVRKFPDDVFNLRIYGESLISVEYACRLVRAFGKAVK